MGMLHLRCWMLLQSGQGLVEPDSPGVFTLTEKIQSNRVVSSWIPAAGNRASNASPIAAAGSAHRADRTVCRGRTPAPARTRASPKWPCTPDRPAGTWWRRGGHRRSCWCTSQRGNSRSPRASSLGRCQPGTMRSTRRRGGSRKNLLPSATLRCWPPRPPPTARAPAPTIHAQVLGVAEPPAVGVVQQGVAAPLIQVLYSAMPKPVVPPGEFRGDIATAPPRQVRLRAQFRLGGAVLGRVWRVLEQAAGVRVTGGRAEHLDHRAAVPPDTPPMRAAAPQLVSPGSPVPSCCARR